MGLSDDNFRQQVHCFFFRPLLDEIRATAGEKKLDEVLARHGVTRAQLEDPTGWVSLALAHALVVDFEELAGGPGFIERCSRLAISPKYMGMLRPILRAFGTPGFAYVQVAKTLPRFNKVGQIQVVERAAGRLVLRYSALPDAPPETVTHFCRGRIGQFAAFPTMWDLPEARVEHPKCMLRGDDACVYEIRYTEPGSRLGSRVVGPLVGLAIAAGVAFALAPPTPIIAALAVLGVAAGWGVGRVRELARSLRTQTDDLAAHNDALVRSAAANEERYRELLEAKADVDEKVEQRTHELSETSAKLAVTLEEVRALDRAKTDFFANVSHELRTPLTLIVAPLQDLVAGREPPGGTKATLATMQRNSLRLLRLINQLLDLAKVDAGGAKVARTPGSPIALVQSVAAAFRPLAVARKIEIAVQAPETAAPVAFDSEWMDSALSNLVANAMRFARDGGKVTLALTDRGHEVVFDVIDDGPGIAPEDIATVFDRFAQGGDTHARRGGTGLGLAIVREAARLHGGDVSLKSELGHGATFSVRIPRSADTAIVDVPEARTSAPIIRPSAAVDLPAAEVESERVAPSPDAPLVLVVEDNDDVRAYIADVLGSRYRIKTARNGREGLELARAERPVVIVTDVAMPEMDGLAMTRAIRSDSTISHTPVLLLTARTDATHVLEGFDAGGDDYVMKPFHARELVARVDVHVRLRRFAQQLAQSERLAMLGTLAASVAHHVRNPLTSMRTGLPVMKKRNADKLDARSLQMLDVMIDCADRIDRLTLDLLDLSRVDRATKDTFDPIDGLRTSLRLIGARVPDGVRVEEHIDASGVMEGKPADIHHALLNLLDNAARAIGESGVIEVTALRKNGSLEIRIDDSGPGVEPALVEKVFEPFFTTRPAGQGSGLGLAIVKQTVTEHGGTIAVGRSPHGGASFVVSLPLLERGAVPRS